MKQPYLMATKSAFGPPFTDFKGVMPLVARARAELTEQMIEKYKINPVFKAAGAESYRAYYSLFAQDIETIYSACSIMLEARDIVDKPLDSPIKVQLGILVETITKLNNSFNDTNTEAQIVVKELKVDCNKDLKARADAYLAGIIRIKHSFNNIINAMHLIGVIGLSHGKLSKLHISILNQTFQRLQAAVDFIKNAEPDQISPKKYIDGVLMLSLGPEDVIDERNNSQMAK